MTAAVLALRPETTIQLVLVLVFVLVSLVAAVVLPAWAQMKFGPEVRLIREVEDLRAAGWEHKEIIDILKASSEENPTD